MKGKLEFNLPEEQEEFEIACNASKYNLVLFQFDQELRSKIKYQNLNEKEQDIYQKVREMLWSCLDNAGLDIL